GAQHQADVADRDGHRSRIGRAGLRDVGDGEAERDEDQERQEEAQLQGTRDGVHQRSRRMRTRPMVSSSPNESATGRSMRWPFTYVPLVLPWSSMNQLRPRKVSMAWVPLTKSSSTKMVLLTFRPMELIGPSAITLPSAGSSAGYSTPESLPIPDWLAICVTSALRRSRSRAREKPRRIR